MESLIQLRDRRGRMLPASPGQPSAGGDAVLILAYRRVAVLGDLLCVGMHPSLGAGALRQHLAAFLAEPEKIESSYPESDFWGDPADRNRTLLRSGPR